MLPTYQKSRLYSKIVRVYIKLDTWESINITLFQSYTAIDILYHFRIEPKSKYCLGTF